MNVETEILAAGEIRPSDVETQVYDQHARFYDYGETAGNKAENQTAARPRKNISGIAALLAAVLTLFGGLSAVFFYFTVNFWPAVSVNQVSAENLPDDETLDSARAREAEKRENGLAPEKSVKNIPADDKINFEHREENEPVVASSKPVEKKAFPGVNPKIDSSSEKKNQMVSVPDARNEFRRERRSQPSMVETTAPEPPPSVEPRRPPINGVFRNLPKDRTASAARKTNDANPERRFVFRERRTERKRKNQIRLLANQRGVF